MLLTVGILRCEDGFHANLIDNIFQKSFEKDSTKHYDHIHNIASGKSHPLFLLLLGPFPFLSLPGILLHLLNTFHKLVKAFAPSQASQAMTLSRLV